MRWFSMLFLSAVLLLAGCSSREQASVPAAPPPAQAPPPQEGPPAEAPPPAETTAPSVDEVAAFIEDQVSSQTEGGTFKIKDVQAGTDLSLTLDKVHRDRLSEIGPHRYFVCADFTTQEGKVYDLDFWVEGTSAEDLRVVGDPMIHKEAGEPRYTWVKNDKGIWERKWLTEPPPEARKDVPEMAAEHPQDEGAEHPKKDEDKKAEHPKKDEDKKAEHPKKDEDKKAEHPEGGVEHP